MKLDRSKILTKRADEIILGGTTEQRREDKLGPYGYPQYIERAEGAYIWDADGNKYIDYLMSWGTAILGHCYPKIIQKIQEQLQKGIIFNLASEMEIILAEKIMKIIPCAEKVAYFTNGSDATSAAVKVARAYTGREKVIYYGYHGWHEWCQDVRTRGIPRFYKDLILAHTYNDLESLQKMFQTHKGEIACVIMEPVKDEKPTGGFLEGVRDICHENASLLIYDEVKTGFRLALGGGQQFFGVTPDLATFSKALSSGIPFAVLAGKRKILDGMEDVWLNGTYFGNPLSLYVALASLEELENKPVISHIWEKGERLMQGFNQLFDNFSLSTRLKGYPVMPRPRYPKEEAPIISQFFKETIKKGLYLHPNHAWFLSFAHSNEIIDKTLDIVNECLKMVCKKA